LHTASQKPISKNKGNSTEDSEEDEEQELITPSDLETTIRTIRVLGTRLDLFRSAKFKDLRKELYPLIEERIRREGT
jgi:hypothetical protein